MRWAKLSYKQEIAARVKRQAPVYDALCKWHPRFAWYPVSIGSFLDDTDSSTAWMCWVERRVEWLYRNNPEAWSPVLSRFEYRMPERK